MERLGSGPSAGGELFTQIEVELTRVKRMAEMTGDRPLIYFIDMSIIQARSRALGVKMLVPAEEPKWPSKISET